MTASTLSLRAGGLIVCAALSAVRAPAQNAEPTAGFVAEHQAWLDWSSEQLTQSRHQRALRRAE